MAKDRDAGEVYRALAPAVLGYLRAERVPDPEDVLGEVFLQVARDLRRFEGDDAGLRRWVFSIAHNRVIDDVRRRTRRPERLVSAVAEGPAPTPAEPIDDTLIAALHELTADQREVMVLRFVADLSIEQVATLTRRSPGAVKALQHRAVERLSSAVSSPAPSTLT